MILIVAQKQFTAASHYHVVVILLLIPPIQLTPLVSFQTANGQQYSLCHWPLLFLLSSCTRNPEHRDRKKLVCGPTILMIFVSRQCFNLLSEASLNIVGQKTC